MWLGVNLRLKMHITCECITSICFRIFCSHFPLECSKIRVGTRIGIKYWLNMQCALLQSTHRAQIRVQYSCISSSDFTNVLNCVKSANRKNKHIPFHVDVEFIKQFLSNAVPVFLRIQTSNYLFEIIKIELHMHEKSCKSVEFGCVFYFQARIATVTGRSLKYS